MEINTIDLNNRSLEKIIIRTGCIICVEEIFFSWIFVEDIFLIVTINFQILKDLKNLSRKI